jgi:hypothetical protein
MAELMTPTPASTTMSGHCSCGVSREKGELAGQGFDGR